MLEIDTRQCAMKSLQEPYKLCRSEPWHNETTSSRWEYEHLSTASTALLQNSITQAAKSKQNWTFTLHLHPMFAQCQFHSRNLHVLVPYEFFGHFQVNIKWTHHFMYNNISISVNVEMKGKHGYLSASDWPLYPVSHVM